MARMMPSYCPLESPPGERTLFNALASSPSTNNWIVLHSLGIASHVKQIEGEADFVVVVPGCGILVVEVKSHQSVFRLDDGTWILGRQQPTARSPFQQASDAKHSIRTYLQTKGVDLRSTPMLDAVWFTNFRARNALPESPEWHEWQILDLGDMDDPSRSILRVFEVGSAHLKSRPTAQNFAYVEFDESRAAKVVTVLRPRFEVLRTPSDSRRYRESELSGFIEEQFEALDAMDENQAVLFTGLAGTGKTLLAVEVARRMSSLGGQGRLLCFNRLLGRRLRADVIRNEYFEVGTFHQELLKMIGKEVPQGVAQQYWEQELPDKALEILLDRGPPLDYLVVDEAQDLTDEKYLDVFDLLLRGGLANGRVMFFGDFEGQSIFASGDGRSRLRNRIPNLAQFSLNVNCRNLPRIGTVVGMFSRLGNNYRRFRRGDDGIDPTIRSYRTDAEQSVLLTEAVQSLQSEGFRLDEMVVLSLRNTESLAETADQPWLKQILVPANGDEPIRGRLQFSTIHAFKGLEARCVILTDLKWAPSADLESLFYIGMTRATDRLYVLIETETLRAIIGGNK